MQTLEELSNRFAIQDHLTFHETHPGMLAARVTTQRSDATLYLQGAHLTQWTPRDGSPVLYLSPNAAIAPGKSIRGGIPVLFPWFGDRWNAAEFDTAHDLKSPAHGFARTALWTVERTHLTPEGEVIAVLSLPASEQTARLGYPAFLATLEVRTGRELHVALTVTNSGTEAMPFEEGLHTYLAVGDIAPVRLDGLRGSTYIDKRDKNLRKVQRETEFAFTRAVDQVHVRTAEPITVHDPANHRAIHVTKEGSSTTVIWNPWSTLTPGMPDLPADGWQHFACVETVNAADDRITLAPGKTHGMALTLGVTHSGEPARDKPSTDQGS